MIAPIVSLSPIEQVRLRPALYFGTKSLTAFRHYCDGYTTACIQHGIDARCFDLRIPDDFHDWVAYRTHHSSSTMGWCHMILATTPSEEEAFDRFFELLDQHARRIPHLIAEIIHPTSRLSRIVNLATREEEPIPAPAKVQLVKYNDHDPGFFALYDSPDFRDQFLPCLDRLNTISGGERVVHDLPAHHQLLREQVAWDLKRERDRNVWARIRSPTLPPLT